MTTKVKYRHQNCQLTHDLVSHCSPRIRSSSSTSSKPAASGSAGPSISVTPAAVQKSASKRSSSLRPSRSIPLLRVKPELNTAGTKQNESSHLQARSRTLRRFGSSPLLGTNVASKRQPEAGGGHDLGPSSFHQGDVLGRLLGWNETPTVDLSANTATDPEGEMTPRKTSRGKQLSPLVARFADSSPIDRPTFQFIRSFYHASCATQSLSVAKLTIRRRSANADITPAAEKQCSPCYILTVPTACYARGLVE